MALVFVALESWEDKYGHFNAHFTLDGRWNPPPFQNCTIVGIKAALYSTVLSVCCTRLLLS